MDRTHCLASLLRCCRGSKNCTSPPTKPSLLRVSNAISQPVRVTSRLDVISRRYVLFMTIMRFSNSSFSSRSAFSSKKSPFTRWNDWSDTACCLDSISSSSMSAIFTFSRPSRTPEVSEASMRLTKATVASRRSLALVQRRRAAHSPALIVSRCRSGDPLVRDPCSSSVLQEPPRAVRLEEALEEALEAATGAASLWRRHIRVAIRGPTTDTSPSSAGVSSSSGMMAGARCHERPGAPRSGALALR
mmetsp:Transcript_49903/g.133067  ORF Transcript_49903/g.133067 Transcript_49903/m.133067 type:complete len:246 (+) Transcript_49903:128-865(+)